MSSNDVRDSLTGVDTTGHEWDGVRELNNPLPRWWLYVFYACIVFSIGYMVMYPSVPLGTSYFKGTSDYSARVEVEQKIAEARAAQGQYLKGIEDTDVAAVRDDANLLAFAVAGGGAVFTENCAPCHGTGATGGPGYPNLQDDDWLWGGTVEDIQTTITHGIRWESDDDTRISDMPAFGADELLEAAQIEEVANYVRSLSGLDADPVKAKAGAVVFEEQCAACHGDNGGGITDVGAPALNDAVWLYGDSLDAIISQINKPRQGVMPAWTKRLDPTTIKMLAVYVHELGGGQ